MTQSASMGIATTCHQDPPVPPTILGGTHHNNLLAQLPSTTTGIATANGRPPEYCRAKFSYTASQPDELSIVKGDHIRVVEKSSDSWWRGELLTENTGAASGASGWFPSNYAAMEAPAPVTPTLRDGEAEESGCSLLDQSRQSQDSTDGCGGGGVATGPLESVITLYSFVKNQEEELSFDANTTLQILEKPVDDPDWWKACNSHGEIGLVPKNYLRIQTDNISKIEPDNNYFMPPRSGPPVDNHQGNHYNPLQQNNSLLQDLTDQTLRDHQTEGERGDQDVLNNDTTTAPPMIGSDSGSCALLRSSYNVTGLFLDRCWYWGVISRADCEAMLSRFAKTGQFIVRDSESHPGDLTVTMLADTKNRNFKVHQEDGCYHIGQKQFASMDELIEHYRTHPIFKNEYERHYLTEPFQPPGQSSH